MVLYLFVLSGITLYCISFDCIACPFIVLYGMAWHGIVLYLNLLHSIACYFMVSYGIAWYCIVFVFFAPHRTVMYRCYSAPANYRVVHLVILLYMPQKRTWFQKVIIDC